MRDLWLYMPAEFFVELTQTFKRVRSIRLGTPKGGVVQNLLNLVTPYLSLRIFGVGPRYLARTWFPRKILFFWKKFSRALVTRVRARDFGFLVFQKMHFLKKIFFFKNWFWPKNQKWQKRFFAKISALSIFNGSPKLGICRNVYMSKSGFDDLDTSPPKKSHFMSKIKSS